RTGRDHPGERHALRHPAARVRDDRSYRGRTRMSTPTLDDATVSDTAQKSGLRGHLRAGLQQLLAFGGLIVIMIVFSFTSPVFLTFNNIVNNMMFSAVVIGVLGLGTTFVIITAGIDLSIVTGLAMAGVIAGNFVSHMG